MRIGVSEKTVMQAIANSKVDYEEWLIRKEIRQGKPILHLYIELNDDHQSAELAPILHGELIKTDPGYHDLAVMMDIDPLEVTLLPQGTFRCFYRQRKEGGLELAQRKPPRMNASDEIIEELIGSGDRQEVPVA